MKKDTKYTFDRPWVLLCEGESDLRFFNCLIKERNINPGFCVRFPDRGTQGTGGRGNFGWWLDLVYSDASESFKQIVESVLVVADKDDNEEESLSLVRNEIEKAGFPVPAGDQMVAKAPGFPSIVILMIPIEGIGNLETLCMRAAETKWNNLMPPLNKFVTETPANGWGISKQSKMRLQTTLAATCKKCPDISFARHWFQNPDYRIPLDHSCFNSVTDFLRNFGALIAGT
jgi:hypothetical protein